MKAKDWKWIKTINSNNEVIEPLEKDAFILSLDFKEGRFNAKTDCNRFFGNFKLNAEQVVFTHIGSTRMRCQNSQERVFIDQLALSKSYNLDQSNQIVELIAEDESKILLEAL